MANEDATVQNKTNEQQVEPDLTRIGEEDPAFVDLKEKIRRDIGLVPVSRLGSGSFSVVFRADHYNEDGERTVSVAMKIIDTRAGSDYVRRFLPREREIVPKLIHPNIVRAFSIIDYDPYVVFLTEMCPGGTLLDKVLAMKRIPERYAKGVFRQLIDALAYLQSKDIIHRDLKCENVFFDANDNVKLGDFGFARNFRKGDVSSTFCGSRSYVAPEVLSATDYTGFATDMWSSGIVLYVMVSGAMPFDHRDPRKMMQKQFAHQIKYPAEVLLSTAVRSLIQGLLHPLPQSRLTITDIYSSDWLAGVSTSMRKTPIPQ